MELIVADVNPAKKNDKDSMNSNYFFNRVNQL